MSAPHTVLKSRRTTSARATAGAGAHTGVVAPRLRLRARGQAVSAERPALGVWIEGAASGANLPLNHLDAMPGEPITFTLPNGVSADDLTIWSFYDL